MRTSRTFFPYQGLVAPRSGLGRPLPSLALAHVVVRAIGPLDSRQGMSEIGSLGPSSEHSCLPI